MLANLPIYMWNHMKYIVVAYDMTGLSYTAHMIGGTQVPF